MSVSSTLRNILSRFKDARQNGNSWSCRCPAHEDASPSLSISEGDDGRVLLHCHAGCTTQAICEALRISVSDLFEDQALLTKPLKTSGSGGFRLRRQHKDAKTYSSTDEAISCLQESRGRISGRWLYTDQDGRAVGVIVRWDLPNGKKDILPISRTNGGWIIGGMPQPRPLYRLTEVTPAERVYVFEGEKCVEAALSIGLVATTSPHGAKSADKADWTPLAGKEVVIIPDSDAPGRAYASTVKARLEGLAPPAIVSIVELDGLAEGDDIVDWLDQREAAEPDDLRRQIENLVEGTKDSPPLASPSVEFTPFPVEILPEPMRGFVIAGSKAICCDPSYIALVLLAVVAGAVGNTRRIRLKRSWSEPAIIWTGIVGDSGTSKTPAFKLVMRPVRERQRKALAAYCQDIADYQVQKAQWERDYAAWKRSKSADDPPEEPSEPQPVRFLVSDTTVEALAPILLSNPRGLIVARDELSGLFNSFDRYAGKGKSSADAAHWLSMHNAETIIVDRKTGSPRTICVPLAAVSMTGGIQPTILQRIMSRENRESGMLARLLLAAPPRQRKRWTEADIDHWVETSIELLLDKLYELRLKRDLDGESHPVDLPLTADAKRAWIRFYNEHAAEQAELTGDLSAAWSKLEGYAARIALVIQLVRWANDEENVSGNEVDEVSINAGVTLSRWFGEETKRVYRLLTESDDDRDRRRLLELIARKGGSITARELFRSTRSYSQCEDAEQALQGLVDLKQGNWRKTPSGEPGRPTRVFQLSVNVDVTETPKNSSV